MNDIEEKILSYPHLPVEKQRDVEAYVESNPEWAALLRDVRSIEHLSSNVQADLPPDALLATYVVIQHLHPEEVPSRLQTAFSKFEARLEDDEALRQEVEAAHHRLREAEAAIDPVSHFEALTEHNLNHEARSGDIDAVEAGTSENRETTPSLLETILNLSLLVRGGVVVAVVLMGLYGGLYGVSLATQSTLDRLAAVQISDQVVDSYANAEMRSPVPGEEPAVDERYLEALSALEDARVSTLGLFPHYDAEPLTRAKGHLEKVLEAADPESFLALEAHFYLGKIALAQEEVDVAQGHFKTVVQQEGRRSEEAYEILKTLQQEYVEQND